MATLNPGSIYLIESDAVDNDNWIGDHAGDPDHVLMTNYTEGTEYAEISKILGYSQNFRTGAKVTDVGSGTSYEIKYGRRNYVVPFQGLVSSLASANKVQKICMIDRHTTTTGYKRYYLIIKFATGSYVEFVDNDGNDKKYCKGIVVPGGRIRWSDTDPLVWNVSLTFRSVWQ